MERKFKEEVFKCRREVIRMRTKNCLWELALRKKSLRKFMSYYFSEVEQCGETDTVNPLP